MLDFVQLDYQDDTGMRWKGCPFASCGRFGCFRLSWARLIDDDGERSAAMLEEAHGKDPFSVVSSVAETAFWESTSPFLSCNAARCNWLFSIFLQLLLTCT